MLKQYFICVNCSDIYDIQLGDFVYCCDCYLCYDCLGEYEEIRIIKEGVCMYCDYI